MSSTNPAAKPAPLPTRRYSPAFTVNTDAHWCRGDAAMTHVLNTYTLLVPDNEGFYIRTLSRCMPKLNDPGMERQVHDFVRQEGQHGVGHRKAWRVLEEQGYRFMNFVKGVALLAYGPMEKLLPLWLRTSMVAAIEHVNAFMGREFLADDLLAGADPEMRALFEWHFAEEIEHRSVSFDVLHKLWPSYWSRAVGAALTFPLFYLVMTIGMLNLMRQDGSIKRASTWKNLWAHLWTRDRMIQRTLRHIGSYFRPSFHPSQMTGDELAAAAIARWSDRVHETLVPAPALVSVPREMANPVTSTSADSISASIAASVAAPLAEQTPMLASPAALSLVTTKAQSAERVARRAAMAPGVTGLASDYGFSTLRITSDAENSVHWCYMHPQSITSTPDYRACFHTALIGEINEFQKRLGMALRRDDGAHHDPMPHVVIASDADVFNLGGDLALFSRLIRARDRDGLLAYARACVNGVYAFHAGLGADVHSIALVRGDALGGGFEAALSCHTIVAEEGANMGLPEVLFDLFPGMGAFSFLRRRIGESRAEKMMLSGDIFSADELHELGIVDVLVPRGRGEAAVMDVVRRNQRIPHARAAMQRVRNAVAPVSHGELMQVTEIWVDTAMQLQEKSLRTMERLVRAQLKRGGNGARDGVGGSQVG